MTNPLISYIKKCKDLSVTDVTIYSILKESGWKEEDVNYAFEEFKKIELLPPPPAPEYDAKGNSLLKVEWEYESENKLRQNNRLESSAKFAYNNQNPRQDENPNQNQKPLEIKDVQRKQDVIVKSPKISPIQKVKQKITGVVSKIISRRKKVKPLKNAISEKNEQNFDDMDRRPSKPLTKSQETRNKINRFLAKAKKILMILIGIGAIALIIWWVISLNSKSLTYNIDADNKRLEQMDKIQNAISVFNKEQNRLPRQLSDIDSQKEFIIDKGTQQPFDYKILKATSFQVCTVFYTKGENYDKGYVCFPYEVNATGEISAGLPFNVLSQEQTQTNAYTQTSVPFYNCKNPKQLVQVNMRCTEPSGNCRKPFILQEFGLQTIGLSNNKDKIAQTFKLPTKNVDFPGTQLTEVTPFVFTYYGNMGCMSIYELEDETQPQSGRLLVEYEINLSTLKKEDYNKLFIEPITLDPKKSYSVVFSLMDNASFISFTKGNEMSNYYEGSAYYLKRPAQDCTGENCPIVEWTNRDDDLKIQLKFF